MPFTDVSLPINSFQGRRKDNFNRWLIRFNALTDYSLIDEPGVQRDLVKTILLQTKLEKRALKFYNELCEEHQDDWKRLTTSLRLRFPGHSKAKRKAKAMKKLSELEESLNESTPEYVSRTRAIISELGPKYEWDAISKMIRGLETPEVRLCVEDMHFEGIPAFETVAHEIEAAADRAFLGENHEQLLEIEEEQESENEKRH